MKIRELEVSGYRGLQSVVWRPGGLAVVTGDGADTLAAAVFQLARAVGGWSEFGESLVNGVFNPLGAVPDELRPVVLSGGDHPVEKVTVAASEAWLSTPGETRWRVVCTPEPDGNLDFTLEITVERHGDGAWRVVHERITRSDDFTVTEVLSREGNHARYVRTPRAARGRPVKPVTESTGVAGDMTSLGMIPRLRSDPQVAPHAEAMAGWMRYAGIATDGNAPARITACPRRWQDVLTADGSNLVGVLYTACESPAGRARLDRGLAAAVKNYETVHFPTVGDGMLGFEVHAGGVRTALADLPEATVAVLLAFAPLASTQPPGLIWYANPLEDAPEAVAEAFAAVAAQAAGWTQVVVATGSQSLWRALRTHGPKGVGVSTGTDGCTVTPVPVDADLGVPG